MTRLQQLDNARSATMSRRRRMSSQHQPLIWACPADSFASGVVLGGADLTGSERSREMGSNGNSRGQSACSV